MSKVILIVEDEPMNLKLFRDLLNISGYATLDLKRRTAGSVSA